MSHRLLLTFALSCLASAPIYSQSHKNSHSDSIRQQNKEPHKHVARVPTKIPDGKKSARYPAATFPTGSSVARLWNEVLLEAIRLDTPRPSVHARNLFHVSAAMYDAWAAYDSKAVGYFTVEAPPNISSAHNQRAAISYAAYRVLTHRFANSPGHELSQARFDQLMEHLKLNPRNTSTKGSSGAAIGNRIGRTIIEFGLQDGSNEQNNYAQTVGYRPINDPLIVDAPIPNPIFDINRWQPLFVPTKTTPQGFLTPHWNLVGNFALSAPNEKGLHLDTGPPPQLGGVGNQYILEDIIQLISHSSTLDPGSGELVNLSPRVVGNNSLGMEDGMGHPLNPATGAPYEDNYALAGDWGRVLAEFWADGPLSTTPPGHWNEIANSVSDHPFFEKRIGGTGPIVSDLEWDVKVYFALNGAAHDAAVATWGVKSYYDYGRPITMIRHMALRGQSSDENLPRYDSLGLPLVPGLIEQITPESSATGERHEHLADFVGECAVYAWLGHPADPGHSYGGVGWILGIDWLPYQQFDFVTPPFAGYTSGHSGFSRASAEVLTLMTGDPYFPGGIGEFLATAEGGGGFHLRFEYGPVLPVLLQWATYYDAADEAGISRTFGGIHPRADDRPGRVLGSTCGIAAYWKASKYWEGHP